MNLFILYSSKRWRYYEEEEESEYEKKTQKIVEFKIKNLNNSLHK